MYLVELGRQMKTLRKAAGFSQAQLAQLSGVARETLSRIENGSYNDIGIKKLVTLFDLVGGELSAQPRTNRNEPDFVRRAVSTANVSNKRRMHGDELIQAFVTGVIPTGMAGHLYSMFDDLSSANQEALIEQIGTLANDKATVRRGVERLRARLSCAS